MNERLTEAETWEATQRILEKTGVPQFRTVQDDDVPVQLPNPSGILPTGYKVLVKSEESVEEQKLKSMGLIAAETTKERLDAQSVIGRLIAVSPLAFTYHEGWSKEDQPKPGQRVVYGKYSGTTLKGKDDVDYRLVNDQDIGAVLEF